MAKEEGDRLQNLLKEQEKELFRLEILSGTEQEGERAEKEAFMKEACAQFHEAYEVYLLRSDKNAECVRKLEKREKELGQAEEAFVQIRRIFLIRLLCPLSCDNVSGFLILHQDRKSVV